MTWETSLTSAIRGPIAVANQKGGVGKTSTVVNVAAVLATTYNMKVLVIDVDPQGHVGLSLGVDVRRPEQTVAAALLGVKGILDVVHETHVKNLWVIPSNEDLAAVEEQIARQPGREAILKHILEPALSQYDVMLIDTPPNLGVLTFNALMASRYVLVPIQPRFFSIEGLRRLYHVIELLRVRLRANVEVIGHFLTMVDNRYKVTQEVREDLRKRLGESLMSAEIPSSVRLEEGHFYRSPCVIYSPDSPIAKAYVKLTEELLERLYKWYGGNTLNQRSAEGGAGLYEAGVDKNV